MQTYEFTAPSGEVYEIDVPDGMSPMEAANYLPSEPNALPEPALQAGIREYGVPDGGPLENIAIAAGRTASRVKEGATDLFQRGADALGLGDYEDDIRNREQEQMNETRLFEPFENKNPATAMIAGEAPFAGVPGRVLPQMLAAGMEYGSPGERIGNMAMVGAANKAGQVATDFAVGRGIPNDVPDYNQQLIRRGDELGFKVTPSARTGGDRGMQAQEARIESSKYTAKATQDIYDHNNERLNEIALGAIGSSGNKLTPDVMQHASDDISREFLESVGDGPVNLDDTFITDIARIKREYVSVPGRRNKRVADTMEDLIKDWEKGTLSPKKYLRYTSGLATDARTVGTKDSALAGALYDIRQSLDDALDRSLGDAEGIRAARDKWRTYLTLEASVNDVGDVSYKKLSNILKRTDKHGYLRGNKSSDLYDAVRFFRNNDRAFGSSGTAERTLAENRPGPGAAVSDMREFGTAGAAVGGGLGQMLGDPVSGAGVGAGIGAAMGLMSRPAQSMAAKAYLSPRLNTGVLPGVMGKGGRDAVEMGARVGALGLMPMLEEELEKQYRGLMPR